MGSHRNLALALTATLTLKALTVLPALLLAHVVDNAGQPDISALPTLLLFLVLVTVQALFIPMQSWCLAHLTQNRVRTLSTRWCRDLLDKRFEVYNQLQGGTLVKVLDRGITAQERWLGFLIGSAWPVLAEAIILTSLFLYLGAGAVLLGLIPLSLGYLLINSRLVRWRRPHIDAVNEQEDKLAEQWADTFASATVIKLECAEAAAMRPVEDSLAGYANAAVRVATSAGWLQAIRIIFIGLGSGGLLAWGMHDQAQTMPSLSLGELVALFTLIAGLLAGIAQLAETWRMLDQFRADRHKLEKWLRLPAFGPSFSDSNKNHSEAIGGKGLRFTPCSLQENEEQRLILEQALTIKPGERVALAGPSGSGKSTLLNALAGTCEPLRKHLYLDGTTVEQLDASRQLTRLRLCPQEDRFIPGVLSQSVLFDQHHEKQHLEELLEKLGFSHDWYKREIGGRGENISGGEARRLSILRILCRPGEFNLLDEPTSGLDAALAQKTWDLLFEALKGHGLICVTHDQTALARFDRVIWMEGGRITSIDTHNLSPTDPPTTA